MSVLLHLSDPHFGTQQAPVVAALLALAAERRPDVVVLSGDITQRARPEQFAAARRFCDALGHAPLLALPGNHDIPLFNLAARLFRPYGRYKKAFGNNLEPVVHAGGFRVVGVNTTRAARHVDGVVSKSQIERVSRELQPASRDDLRVVVTHQPVAVLRPQDAHDRLHGAGPAIEVWSRAGADLVLGGHIHLPYVMNLQDGTAPAARAMWCVQAGTALSSRIRHGTCNSVNLIHWHVAEPGSPRRCRVEQCDFSVATGRFVPARSHTLALGD